MSLPNIPDHPWSHDLSSSQQRNIKQKQRTVRLELPSREMCKTPPVGLIARSPDPQQSPSSSDLPLSTHVPSIQRSEMLNTTANIQLVSPNVFYQFPQYVEPAFVYEVVTPDTAFPFSVQPGLELVNPRFLIYSVCATSVAISPVKFVVNGTKISHWMSNPMPIDVTELLVPFGNQNWLIVETGNLVVPFSIIGVWCSLFTFHDIINSIQSREKLVYDEIGAVCPITGQPIEIPARGIKCAHQLCFDLISFITSRQALGIWTCPICDLSCHIDDIRICGTIESPEVAHQEHIADQIWTYQNQQEEDHNTEQFDEGDSYLFWNQS